MSEPRWYIIHAYSGYERRVADTIIERAAAQEMDELILEVMVPMEEVVEIKRGQRVKSERKFFPGYVLIKMIMTEDAYHVIKDTPKVTGFLGPQGNPTAISDQEAARILHQVEEGVERPRSTISFEIGEEVRVTDGPFNSFNGHVEDVDEERSRLKVSVSIFGRPTPVELEFTQVEKT